MSNCGYGTVAGGKKVRLGSGESRGKFYKAKTVLFGTERKGKKKAMDIKTECIGTTLVVKLAGEIDHHSAPELKEEADRAISMRNIVNLVLDFDGVTFMDSSGIGVIIGRYKQIQARGGKVMIIRVKPQVDKVLEVSGLKKIMDCSH